MMKDPRPSTQASLVPNKAMLIRSRMRIPIQHSSLYLPAKVFRSGYQSLQSNSPL